MVAINIICFLFAVVSMWRDPWQGDVKQKGVWYGSLYLVYTNHNVNEWWNVHVLDKTYTCRWLIALQAHSNITVMAFCSYHCHENFLVCGNNVIDRGVFLSQALRKFAFYWLPQNKLFWLTYFHVGLCDWCFLTNIYILGNNHWLSQIDFWCLSWCFCEPVLYKSTFQETLNYQSYLQSLHVGVCSVGWSIQCWGLRHICKWCV